MFILLTGGVRSGKSTLAARMLETFPQEKHYIATMRVFRRSVGGEAMVIIELDGNADQALIDCLSAMPGIYHVAYVAARSEGV